MSQSKEGKEREVRKRSSASTPTHCPLIGEEFHQESGRMFSVLSEFNTPSPMESVLSGSKENPAWGASYTKHNQSRLSIPKGKKNSWCKSVEVRVPGAGVHSKHMSAIYKKSFWDSGDKSSKNDDPDKKLEDLKKSKDNDEVPKKIETKEN